MGRTALVLIAALVVGAGAGLFVHEGRARAPLSTPAALERSPRPEAPRTFRQRRPAAGPAVVRGAPTKISIPRLHLKSRVFPFRELNRGPAWWPITGRPGGGDTIAVAGHRTTHSRPFYSLERLHPGDAVYVRYRGAAHRYRVVSSHVVSATNLHIADAVGYERLLLSACTPRGSARFRLVVEARPA